MSKLSSMGLGFRVLSFRFGGAGEVHSYGPLRVQAVQVHGLGLLGFRDGFNNRKALGMIGFFEGSVLGFL